MVGHRTVSLEFDEPDLSAQPPQCVDCVAAALMLGFPLTKPPAANHEDVLLGCERLQQFKDARRARLTRKVRFHFYAIERLVEGELVTAAQFRNRWDADAKLRAALMAAPRFAEWRVALCARLAKARPAALAVEGIRRSYGKLGGDPVTLAAMARFHEEGVGS